MKSVPFLKLDPEWEICVIAPFGGAVARFVIRKGENTISVYLDPLEALGCWETPHWEIYPNSTDDNERFALTEPDKMLDAIRSSFAAMETKETTQPE